MTNEEAMLLAAKYDLARFKAGKNEEEILFEDTSGFLDRVLRDHKILSQLYEEAKIERNNVMIMCSF